ncbi:DUF4767 domain-containing protein [Lacticaseibacillus casei]|jgi:hypothetical protein|uniref:DUF4767 domain-containing protein n=1 Tax=Lacticaseibacillus huelsenbergensis TaxID=3035291 RepID=A0ABY8DQU0_9LACO|nr:MULTISPECIES: DUF4767 domain-containing protein [Lacticaseibacillus]MDG3060812.1 DUF4767 domain-containing protein [Lacticaseibacillus sp. BCRC 81376]QVI37396.1 DUF4767 domain-containing protein [Lacticaseibacillus casei]QXG59187.1 DUF4767 domain-containing protein [Lacticaseibacillus casei]WFB39358.1 DUF4767 domain-containing protein [Lacticaseibacillus huelsenbergensis]WFB41061.1 DUF4767 domain-containing protein [Lacticaseibacillus huelsenbergensis]
MKKSMIGVATLLFALGLSGCGSQQKTSQKTSTPSKTQVSSSKASASSASKQPSASSQKAAKSSQSVSSSSEQPVWSSAKGQQLAAFISEWEKTMGQQYESYWQGNSADMYGLKIPDELSQPDGTNGKMAMAVGDKAVTWALSANGQSNAEYTIVAIYSNAAHARYGGKYVYLFTLHNGQPEVLVTGQNQGNENNWIYFGETRNEALREGFAKIVKGD